MITAPTLKFLKDLKKNNNRVWFEENRERYIKGKEEFETRFMEIVEKKFS